MELPPPARTWKAAKAASNTHPADTKNVSERRLLLGLIFLKVGLDVFVLVFRSNSKIFKMSSKCLSRVQLLVLIFGADEVEVFLRLFLQVLQRNKVEALLQFNYCEAAMTNRHYLLSRRHAHFKVLKIAVLLLS